MAVDGVSESQARFLAQKKRELETEQNNIELDTARAKREGLKQATEQKEKTDKELVQISKAGEQQVEYLRRMNSERVKSMDANQQESYRKLSESTAEQIKRMEADALRAVADHRASTTEKLGFISQQAEDPFYRIKSLNPLLTEREKEFEVKVALPDHEARNLFVSGEGQNLKLSLARRFQELSKNPESAASTKTSSYQTIVESIALPGPFDPKGIKREYIDGVVTIRIPRAGLLTAEGTP